MAKYDNSAHGVWLWCTLWHSISIKVASKLHNINRTTFLLAEKKKKYANKLLQECKTNQLRGIFNHSKGNYGIFACIWLENLKVNSVSTYLLSSRSIHFTWTVSSPFVNQIHSMQYFLLKGKFTFYRKICKVNLHRTPPPHQSGHRLWN